MALLERSEHYGELQRVVDYLYKNAHAVERFDVVIAADTFDICADMHEVVRLLPPGVYTRPALCAQAQFDHCRPRMGVYLRNRRITGNQRPQACSSGCA